MKEVDAKDVEVENNTVTVYGEPSDLYKIKEAILEYKNDADIIFDEVTMIPNEMTTLEGEDRDNFDNLLSMLNEVEDVQKVYHNVNL